MAPTFFKRQDKAAGSPSVSRAILLLYFWISYSNPHQVIEYFIFYLFESQQATDLVWYGDDWSSGGDSKWPITANSKPISSFDVIDDLITRSFNLYPKLKNLVLA